MGILQIIYCLNEGDRGTGWCIIGTGLFDGQSEATPSKERVPTDGTRNPKRGRDIRVLNTVLFDEKIADAFRNLRLISC